MFLDGSQKRHANKSSVVATAYAIKKNPIAISLTFVTIPYVQYLQCGYVVTQTNNPFSMVLWSFTIIQVKWWFGVSLCTYPFPFSLSPGQALPGSHQGGSR